MLSERTLSVIARVHAIAEAQQGVANVWSVETLRRWLTGNGTAPTAERIKSYIDILPVSLVRRFVSEDQKSVLVSARVPDIDASELLGVIKRLDEALAQVRAAQPGYQIEVTGLAALSARSTATIITRLNLALTVEVVFIALFIGLAFRAPTAGLAAILPAVFPVLVAGTFLRVVGEGLQFASVVALIVSFGLGFSATIHFLNRLWIAETEEANPDIAVKQATIYAGPAVILTSMVLAAGLFVTVFSDLPSLRLFGGSARLRSCRRWSPTCSSCVRWRRRCAGSPRDDPLLHDLRSEIDTFEIVEPGDSMTTVCCGPTVRTLRKAENVSLLTRARTVSPSTLPAMLP